mmetsp:Transcript_17938/g.60074  ORF Transcript_17938/g.60074 Transcript_17938/m.60074 type:complete len:409 (-) Transcript_17938:430-1656(-)
MRAPQIHDGPPPHVDPKAVCILLSRWPTTASAGRIDAQQHLRALEGHHARGLSASSCLCGRRPVSGLVGLRDGGDGGVHVDGLDGVALSLLAAPEHRGERRHVEPGALLLYEGDHLLVVLAARLEERGAQEERRLLRACDDAVGPLLLEHLGVHLVHGAHEDGHVWVVTAEALDHAHAVRGAVERHHHRLGALEEAKGAEHVRAARVAKVDRKALVAGRADRLHIEVAGGVAHEHLCEEVTDYLPHAAVPADEHLPLLLVLGEVRDLLRDGPVAAPPLPPAGEVCAQIREEGRRRHAEGGEEEKELAQLRVDDAVLGREAEEHKGKLARLGEEHACADGGLGRDRCRLAEHHEDERLGHVHHEEHEGQGQGVGREEPQVDGVPDGDEEEAEQDPAEGRDVCLDLVAVA